MILLILVILVFLIYNFIQGINIFNTKRNETVIQSDTEKYILTSLPNDPMKGDSVSPVAIYLFADYESDDLKGILKIINDLMVKYPDQVHLVWKDLPLSKHYFARGAALAVRCATDKYWEYNYKLLNREESLSLELYQSIATELGIDLTNFLSCYKSGKYLNDIENNVREAYVLDVSEIPTIFINQELVEGDISFEKLNKMINNLVK